MKNNTAVSLADKLVKYYESQEAGECLPFECFFSIEDIEFALSLLDAYSDFADAMLTRTTKEHLPLLYRIQGVTE